MCANSSQEEEPQFEEFELDREMFPILLRSSKKGPAKYVLVEMSGDERDGYINKFAKRVSVKVTGSGKRRKVESSGVNDYSGLQAALISKCLYPADWEQGDDGVIKITRVADEPESERTIQEFPAKVLDRLYAKIEKMNGLNEEAEDEAKND